MAERAGVSQSTVSRALAGSTAITVATRDRVLAAAKELDYMVDTRAARLRKGSTGTLAVVVICRPGEMASDINPFYFSLLGSVCAAASKQDIETIVSFQSKEEEFFGRYEDRGQADGLIVIGTTSNHAAWEHFRALSDDHATAFWGSPYEDLDWIRSDNYEGGILATRRLIDAGCRDIVHIGATGSPQLQFHERYEGFLAAMDEAGLEPHFVEIDGALDRDAQGRKAVSDLLDRKQPFDGIFAVCDSIALGALNELRNRNVDVPSQCSLIGFDGIMAGNHTRPPLSTIEPDFDVAGAMLVQTVLEKQDEANIKRRVPVRLLDRGSARSL
ncbi:LacI family DNA-binding transcriptional regulator [Altererythrobacter aquaemixtae]|uniref:LacI family DNA-binding transcriptional regulator n=1 Tax=Pontixanthobacter aquaemixtae TaxID=1958940 RepID=A0A844ZRC0_9SPHN|nr:LacI family DNA-binding transcriptional regulator [Pontixanthobacter aquaemixtae]